MDLLWTIAASWVDDLGLLILLSSLAAAALTWVVKAALIKPRRSDFREVGRYHTRIRLTALSSGLAVGALLRVPEAVEAVGPILGAYELALGGVAGVAGGFLSTLVVWVLKSGAKALVARMHGKGSAPSVEESLTPDLTSPVSRADLDAMRKPSSDTGDLL